MYSTSSHPAPPVIAHRATRFVLELEVMLQGDREARPQRTTVVDASTHGLRIQGGTDPLSVGDGVTVTIGLGRAVPIVTRGRIVQWRLGGASEVEFESLRPIDRGRLGGALASRGRPV